MCGITGVFNFLTQKPVDKLTLTKMASIINHRGPDEEGYYINDEHFIGLAHRRLSIIDLLTGQQPMSDIDQKVYIVFNGEIYNFMDLKNSLIKLGYYFKTNSDTEVIINLYKEYREKSFEKLNGIFAFALYDLDRRTLYLVRDHFGVKPLYYFIGKNGVIFGSELKTILIHPDYNKEIDYSSLDTFLTFRYSPSPQTLFKNIYKLNPNSFLKIQLDKKPQIRSYWNYTPIQNNNIRLNEAIEQYQILLERAIIKQMISDVPVGLLLSGGIDSAVLAKIMSQQSKVISYTIGFEGTGDFNELEDAKETAKLLSLENKSIIISKDDYLNFFFKSFYYTEEPISETTIPALYYVCNFASKDLKVVLTGQGADEPLAGYKRYFGEKILNKYYRIFNILPLKSLIKFLPRNERVKRTIYASQFDNELQRYLAIYTLFTYEEKQKFYLDSHLFHNNEKDLEIINKILYNTNNLYDSLNKMLYIDCRMSLSDNLLLFGDKMSMANSLEMRVPFLDLELIQFLESLPSKFKLRGIIHKYIHKKALKKWLPPNIVYRKKRGFATPMDLWLRNESNTFFYKILQNEESFVLKIFDKSFINKLIIEHQKGINNNTRKIFCLLSLEAWYQNFYNNKNLDVTYNYFEQYFNN